MYFGRSAKSSMEIIESINMFISFASFFLLNLLDTASAISWVNSFLYGINILSYYQLCNHFVFIHKKLVIFVTFTFSHDLV